MFVSYNLHRVCVGYFLAAAMIATTCSVAVAQKVQFVKVTQNGKDSSLIQKLITVKGQTPVWPDEARKGKVQYVTAFNIFYHAKTDSGKNESAGMYRIANEQGDSLGWVKTEDVQVWGTRFAIAPITPFDGNHFEVQLAKGGVAQYDPGEIPQTAAAYSFILGAPDESKGGSEDDGPFPVCFCIAEQAQAGTAAELNQIVNLQLEIVFVLELTDFFLTEYDGQPLMNYVKDLGKQYVETIRASSSKGKDVPTRLGLVIYQDTNTNARLKTPVIVQTLTNDLDAWLAKLNSLSAEQIGGDIPEDGYSGIDLALSSKMDWKGNSSKHLVLIGHGPMQEAGKQSNWKPPFTVPMPFLENRGHRLWEDKWDLFFGSNSSGMNVRDIHAKAFPQGGTVGDKLRSTKHLHAIHAGEFIRERLKRRAPDPESIDETLKAIDEVNRIVGGFPEEDQIDYFVNGEYSDIVSLANYFSVFENYQQLAVRQYKDLSQGGDSPGYYRQYMPGKDELKSVIGELKDKVDSAIKVVSEVASGNKNLGDTESSEMTEFSRPIFKLVNSALKSEEVIEIPVQLGTAAVRSSNSGRLVGNKVVMVSQEELKRLHGTFDNLYEQFDKRRSRADRQDVTSILEDLKKSLAQATSGQTINDKTKLNELITDLPLKTSALMLTPGDIAVMSSNDFDSWLEDLRIAKSRIDLLLNGDSSRWLKISQLGNSISEFAFLKLSELP